MAASQNPDDPEGESRPFVDGEVEDAVRAGGVGGERSETFRRVRQFLLDHGATEEEIAKARSEDLLDLLVADRLVVPSAVRYTEAEVCERTGMPVELSRRFWRALGFPDPTPEDAMFTDLDIEAINILESLVELGFADVESALQLARVMGSSMARIADAELSPAMLGVFSPPGSGDSAEAADRFARLADQSLPAVARLLDFVWRRHFQAAIRRVMLLRSRGESASLPELCVGFADMVGFTMLSQQLSEDELAALISRFEDVAHDVVTSGGGRVIKMIGDEVMFVSESPIAAAEIGLALAETYADDELLSDVRVALAVGPVLVQDGDYYGPVVNLANRVADITTPGSVLVTDDFHAALLRETPGAVDDRDPDGRARPDRLPVDEGVDEAAGNAESKVAKSQTPAARFAFKPLRPRVIRDVGRVRMWSLYRPGSEPPGLDHRLGSRWERLAEVLRDLDELRERGERLISSGLRAATQADQGSGASALGVLGGPTARRFRQRDGEGSDARSSGLGQPEGGDAEWPELEGPVKGGEGSASQVDEPS